MKFLTLSNSDKYVLISDEDFAKAVNIRWLFANNYVVSGEGTGTYLHRLIMEPKGKFIVDHINGDTLDNRRENLRICTQAQNNVNSIRKPTSSVYKGVSKTAGRKKNPWKVQYQVNGVNTFLGNFPTEESAALAYNKVVLRIWGEFTVLNDIENKCQVRNKNLIKQSAD